MTEYIIVVSVITVLGKVAKLKLQTLDGNLLDTRKNPHVIDVGLGPSLQHNY